MRYRNFDIRVAPTVKEPFQVTATSPKGKTVKANLSLDAQLKDGLGKLKSGAGGLAGLKELGGRLHSRLFADGLKTLYAEAERGTAPLRVRFCVDAHEADAAAIPWEAIYQEEVDRFLSASSPNALVRYVKSQEPIPGLKLDPPLNVLVVAPKGAGARLRAFVETFEQLREELPGVFDYNTFEGGPAAFKKALSEGLYHVIHFLGAAGCGGEDVADYFVLDAAAGASGSLPAESFAELVTGGQCVKLVVFDCPAAGTDGSWPPLARAANRLVRAGLPAVVAMQFPAGESASQIFARELYSRLCAGAEAGRIDAAVTQARERVRALCEDSADFAAPALFLGAEHGLIFYFERESEAGAAGEEGGPGLPARVWRRLWPFAKASRAARAARRDLLRDARATHKRNVTLLRAKAKRPTLGARQKARLEAQAKEERERAAELGDRLWPWGKTAILALVFSLFVAGVSEFHLLNKLGSMDNYVEHWLVDYANARRNPPIDPKQQLAVVLLEASGAQEAADVGKKQAAVRRQLAELLLKLRAAGARVAAVDVLFDDQTEADGELARAITQAEEPRAEQGRPPMKVLAAVEKFTPQDSQPHVGAKELAAVLGGRYGVVDVAADEKSETVLRSVEVGRYLGQQPGGLVDQLEVYPSLALRAVTEYKLPGRAVKTYYDFNDGVVRVGSPEPGPGDIRVPAQNPFYDRGSKVEQRALFNVWYAGDGSANHTEFVNEYSGLLRRGVEEFDRKFADRIVLVTTPDLKGTDSYVVPHGKKWRGGVVQANVISNILYEQFLVRMAFHYRWLLVALMVAAGLLLHTRWARELRKKIGMRKETAEGEEKEQGVGFPVKWLGDKVQVPLVLCVIAFLYLIAAESFCEHALLVCDITYPLAALVVTYGVFGLARAAAARG